MEAYPLPASENREDYIPCPDPLPYCPYEVPYSDDHHVYWPRKDYLKPVENKFRNLECNIVRGICRCLHDLEHLKKPPAKPAEGEMFKLIREQS